MHCDLAESEPPVFYHFHGINLLPDGSLNVQLPPRHLAEGGVLMRHILEPYLDTFMSERTKLHLCFPELANVETDLRHGNPIPARHAERK